MQRCSSSRTIEMPAVTAAEDALTRLSHAELLEVRRSYIDALPIAAGIVAMTGSTPRLELANSLFRRIDGREEGERRRGAPLLQRGIGRALRGFFSAGEATHDFGWVDGERVDARHFSVRFSRLRALVDGEDRCLVTLLDRTAEVQTEKSLRAEMLTDSLTGLLNRTGFADRAESAIAAMNDAGFALIVVDLRRFGRINESVGALSGDELLITAARRLLSPLRGGDIIARTGANEFGILARIAGSGDEAAAVAVATRLAAAFDEPFRLSDLEIRVDCAVGCALADGAADVDELIRRAQFAAKRAKISGLVERYQPVAFDRARRRFTLETELRRGLEAGRLTLAFQPLVGLRRPGVEGFEALARWRDGDHAIPPTEFIPVAEESGLIVPLGRWALDRAGATLAAWDRTTPLAANVTVAVNVSPLQIAHDDVPRVVADMLSRHGVPGRRLHVELTESAIIADPERAMGVMAALREQGVSVALDDFGTGYSNLAYLQRLPIDMLKIDRSFVSGMLQDRDKAAIVRAILSLSQALGLRTTAEGVDSAALSDALALLGCDRGQGFFYAMPMTADAALAYLSAASA